MTGALVNRRTLAALKRTQKVLREVAFKPLRKGRLPKPFDKMGGARLQSSGLVDVSSDLTAVFLVRDGDTLDRRAFFGHLMQRTSAGLVPITILHYHPSHKGLHLRVNCGSLQDYTERLLPGAPELALATPQGLDPASDWDRKRLVVEFCRRCGIRIAPDDDQLI